MLQIIGKTISSNYPSSNPLGSGCERDDYPRRGQSSSLDEADRHKPLASHDLSGTNIEFSPLGKSKCHQLIESATDGTRVLARRPH